MANFSLRGMYPRLSFCSRHFTHHCLDLLAYHYSLYLLANMMNVQRAVDEWLMSELGHALLSTTYYPLSWIFIFFIDLKEAPVNYSLPIFINFVKSVFLSANPQSTDPFVYCIAHPPSNIPDVPYANLQFLVRLERMEQLLQNPERPILF